MGNAPSVTGPDRGHSHVIRDDDSSVDSRREQRPVRSRVEETVAQLAEETNDEETNRKSSSLSVPKSHASDNCNKIVTDRDAAIQCEICEVWFHTACQNVSDEAYKALKEMESLHWYCDGCNRGASKILHMTSAIKERQEKLDHDFGIMKQEVIGIKQDVEMLMQKTTEIGQEVRELKAERGLQQEGGGSGSGTFAHMPW